MMMYLMTTTMTMTKIRPSMRPFWIVRLTGPSFAHPSLVTLGLVEIVPGQNHCRRLRTQSEADCYNRH